MSKYIGDFLEENGIDYYRQDFNIEPEGFWAANDEPGRQGICEIRYIEGLYSFWEYLLNRFPGLLVDNCASGGRRIDLEVSHAVHRCGEQTTVMENQSVINAILTD